jgi:peptide/nickel transport system ATP-binding protein|tara:strand:+ start:12266 stop:13252 length:987 start_codon:yes stop_codon:yes gene_type:complete
MSNSKPILELQNVSKFYEISRNIKELFVGIKPLVKAVENVSFKIFSGETVGVLGESGCGKTTLGKLILNLLEPSKGNIYFLSEDINNYEGKQIKEFKKNVQLIFQNPYDALNPRFTIKNILLEPLRSLDFPADQHKSLLENVMNLVKLSNVNEYLEKYPHELSGGQLQRVVLARSLIINPLFVVADEPVSMLDVSVRAGILNAFNEAKKKINFTAIYISHDLALVKYVCERTIVMYLGSIVEDGPTDEVVKNPLHPYTKALVSAVPVPHVNQSHEPLPIIGNIPDATAEYSGCKFAERCPMAKEICFNNTPLLENKNENGQKAACHFV